MFRCKDDLREMDLVKVLVAAEKYKLLDHPSTRTFIACKWRALRVYWLLSLLPPFLFAVMISLCVVLDLSYHPVFQPLGTAD